ncbi:hypothetical protein Rsub_00440 [Raphidocelis subcapitata]|uniref:EamA domain-containing protein n=1 Tax=Raphidocelis subcapitata TaxID=307507 RepID=A0A2V0NL02_9CHLO|nr:hypothetical protein Rsub_00440 [Raphidocelis subcapitata]|eukprot:GBF87729.1 hypothetical protein Rsub_00440 [Raphidocelis subcapitata]
MAPATAAARAVTALRHALPSPLLRGPRPRARVRAAVASPQLEDLVTPAAADDARHTLAPTTTPEPAPRAAGPLAWLPRFDGRLRGLVLLNAMVLLMGSNWAVLKSADAATLTDTTVFMAMRFMIAAAMFSPWLRPDKEIIKAGVQIGAWYAAGYVTQALALANTAASRASLLSTFTVLAVPIIAGLSGQRIRPVVWAAAAAALAGTAMLEGSGGDVPPNAGDLWAVASAVLFAAQICSAERQISRLPKRSELPLMAVSMLTVAALCAAAAAAAHAHAGDLPAAAAGVRELLSDWRAALPAALGGGGAVPAGEAVEATRTLQQLMYTAVFTTDAVLFAELVALQDVSSTDAAMIYSLEPVVGALMALVFLGERWGPMGWAGGATIFAASVGAQLVGATDAGGGGGAGGGGDGGGGGAGAGPSA